MKQTLFILCGLPYAGKTVLTNKLASHLSLKIVSVDDIKIAKGFDWSEDEEMTPEDWSCVQRSEYANP